MRINNNIMALNAWRNLNVNQGDLSKSLERLSSGLRINRAADDAAGLAISEKMRAQVSGLQVAQRNAQDAISLIQTAEGALNESHSILQRMRELAVQSASDSNTDSDRAELQKEIDQLAQELSRISDNTEFNTQKLLNGDFKGTFQIGANAGQSIGVSIGEAGAEGLQVAGDTTAGMAITTQLDNVNFDSNEDGLDNVALGVGPQSFTVVAFDDTITGATTDSIDANYGLADSDGNIVALSEDGTQYTLLNAATAEKNIDGTTGVGENGAASSAPLNALDFGHAVTSGIVNINVELGGSDGDDSTIVADATASLIVDAGLAAGEYTVRENSDDNTILELVNSAGDIVATAASGAHGTFVDSDDNTVLRSSDDFEDGHEITVNQGGINVSSQTAASDAITTINDAIETISTQRSELGAVQNRLEHTINNLGVSAENLQAAESRIRDADMAREMSEFTRAQILQQASTAMLAQANVVPQTVLQLMG